MFASQVECVRRPLEGNSKFIAGSIPIKLIIDLPFGIITQSL